MKQLLFLVVFVTCSLARAELTIFDVRKTLPMSDDEKTIRDFYINGGSESGLNQGMIITVTRKVPLYDNYQNRSAGDLDLKVAKVKIIHVQKGLAVARLHSEFTRENAPILEDSFIMVGDALDLNSASSEGKKAEVIEKSSETSAAAKIVVNSVELSSEISSPSAEPPTPNAIENSVLQ